LERSDLTVGGFPVVRLHSGELDLTTFTGQSLVDEHLEPYEHYEHGAFIVRPDRHTVLVYAIRDRSATAAVTAMVAAAGPPVYLWDDTAITKVSLVDRHGSAHLDPRERGLVERIAALPEVAPSPEEEARAGDVDAAIMLAARSWSRGASDEADQWFELAHAASARAVLHIAFSMLPSDEQYQYEDDGLRATETDRVQGLADAAAWLTHRAERGDPLARQVHESLDDSEPDETTRWMWAMISVRSAAPDPPRPKLELGPADLGVDDVEAVLDVLRERGGEPGITSVGGRERYRVTVTDLAAQPDAALQHLVLESTDGMVKVVLARQGSYVTGPRNARERIREIVNTRSARRDPRAWARAMGAAYLYARALWGRAVADAQYNLGPAVDTRSARRDPRAWARAMGFASFYVLVMPAAGVLAVADGRDTAFALFVFAVVFVGAALRVLCRVVALLRPEADWPRRWVADSESGRVRIRARSDRADR
jgi:hypothetical protein